MSNGWERSPSTGRRTDSNDSKSKVLIFPRYHQLDAVRRLVRHARERGPGQHYLIQHSAGSGKSNSIAWLAHRLSVLHDAADRRVFDSIVVITDRRVLDRQLQRTIRQFEQTAGLVENIDQTSRQLKEALESGKTIIVTTFQSSSTSSRTTRPTRHTGASSRRSRRIRGTTGTRPTTSSARSSTFTNTRSGRRSRSWSSISASAWPTGSRARPRP